MLQTFPLTRFFLLLSFLKLKGKEVRNKERKEKGEEERKKEREEGKERRKEMREVTIRG